MTPANRTSAARPSPSPAGRNPKMRGPQLAPGERPTLAAAPPTDCPVREGLFGLLARCIRKPHRQVGLEPRQGIVTHSNVART